MYHHAQCVRKSGYCQTHIALYCDLVGGMEAVVWSAQQAHLLWPSSGTTTRGQGPFPMVQLVAERP